MLSSVAARRAILILACLVLALHAIRSAVVSASSEPWIGVARSVWPTHPDVLGGLIMRDVGQAAASNRPLSAPTLKQVRRLAERDQFAAEPFLVMGTQAYQAGDLDRAERLLLEARRRSPRLPAARFLLASLYIEGGRLAPGLKESAALARLLPGASPHLASALAEYIEVSGGLEQVYRLLKSQPDLAPPLLKELAANPDNADLVLALSSAAPAGPLTAQWKQALIRGLIDQRQYGKAWTTWAKINGYPSRRGLIFDPNFKDVAAAPPFGWELPRKAAIVERRDDKLEVIYFGREPITVARQILLLPPGLYEFGFEFGLKAPRSKFPALAWEVVCLTQTRPIAEKTFHIVSNGQHKFRFAVPSNCGAQDLSLKGQPKDLPVTSEFSIGGVHLAKLGSS